MNTDRQNFNTPTPSIPPCVNGSVKDVISNPNVLYWYPWIEKIAHTDTYVHLGAVWNADGSYPDPVRGGYKNYIISGDTLMIGWAEHLSKSVDGKVIQLFQSFIPDNFSHDNCAYFTYNTAHLRSRKLHNNLDSPLEKNIRFKASALTNRITQSKIIVFSAMKHLLPDNDVVYSLSKSLGDEKNVHNWQLTGNSACDYYIQSYQNQWMEKNIKMQWDDDISWSYNNPAYIESALNFTQESFHYSFMQHGDRCYINPGPFVTEKTWKCLLSETAFIPVGQYHTYRWLKSLGFKFDYGELDLEFDNDPGNLTRLEKIVSVIESLHRYSAVDIFDMTRDCTVYNRQHILSEDFSLICERDNTIFYNFLETLK